MRVPSPRMRMLSLGLAAVAAGTPALLEGSWATDASAQDILDLSPGDTVLVERYVREVPEPPPVIEEHLTLRPGSVIPAAVPLRRFETSPALARYAYFVSVDHKIVVADPRTRVVVRILDQRR